MVSTLRNVLLARGFVEFVDNHHAPNSWNFQWKTTRYSDADSVGPAATADAQADASVARRQRINHFQKTSQSERGRNGDAAEAPQRAALTATAH